MGHQTPQGAGGYRAGVAFRVAGIDYQAGNYLAITGVVAPSIAEAAGKGTARLYSFTDLVALRVVGELRRAHLGLQRVRKCVELLHAEWHESLSTARLLTDGKDALLIRDEKQAVSLLLRPGQYTWRACVDVSGAAKEVRKSLAQEQRRKRNRGAEKRKTRHTIRRPAKSTTRPRSPPQSWRDSTRSARPRWIASRGQKGSILDTRKAGSVTTAPLAQRERT